MWLLFLSISIVLSSAIAILQKMNLKDKKIDSTAYAIFYQIFVGLILAFYTFFHGFNFSGFQEKWPFLIMMVVLYSLGDVLVFKAIQKIDISEYSIVFQVNAFFAVIFSWILLGEGFTNIQWIGFSLVFIGIILSLYEHKIVIHKGHLITVIAAAILALAFINDASIIKNVDMPTYLTFAFLLPGIATLIFYPKSINNIPIILRGRNFLYLLFASIIVSITSITFFLSYRLMNNAAQISSVSKISTVIVVLVGIFFLGEDERKYKKIFGSIIALVGVFFLV